jgi:hypothetical protein
LEYLKSNSVKTDSDESVETADLISTPPSNKEEKQRTQSKSETQSQTEIKQYEKYMDVSLTSAFSQKYLLNFLDFVHWHLEIRTQIEQLELGKQKNK